VRIPPIAHAYLPETACISFVFESENTVVSKADDDHVPAGVAFPPLLRPEVEHVVQVDIGQQGRRCRALRRTRLAFRDDPFFEYSRLSHLRIKRSMRSSPIRCLKKRISQS